MILPQAVVLQQLQDHWQVGDLALPQPNSVEELVVQVEEKTRRENLVLPKP